MDSTSHSACGAQSGVEVVAMSSEPPVPETRVLAIASHVLHGYVGNTAAAFVMQSLGCEVAALNTVQYSNHVGYRAFTGSKTSADEITNLFAGLKQSSLDDFDMMLSGYMPGAEAVMAVGRIARDLKHDRSLHPGSFFWVMDPVMGDNGKLYVAEECVDVYRDLCREADLVVPNQYEAEWLSGVKITDMQSLTKAIQTLHKTHRIPHILITSVRFSQNSTAPTGAVPSLSVIGSTRTSSGVPRIFRIEVPALDCFFSGTGDMFAALMVVRLREAVSKTSDLGQQPSWISPDEVQAVDLPLAAACEKALASMQELLGRTKLVRDKLIEGLSDDIDEKKRHVFVTRAAEVQLVRNLDCLRNPRVEYKAQKVDFEE